MVFYLAKSFTEKLEARTYKDSMIFFTLFNDFYRYSYSCDDRIAQVTACRASSVKCFEPLTAVGKLWNTKAIVDIKGEEERSRATYVPLYS